MDGVVNRVAMGGSAFIGLRYAAAGLGAAKSLLLARLLGADGYGAVALAIQLAGLVEIVGIGGAAGYVLRYFAPDRAADRSLAAFPAAAVAWLATAGALLLLAAPLSPILFWAAALFLINIPYLVFEPMLRVRSRFAATVAPQVALNLAVVALVAGLYALRPDPPGAAVMTAVAAGHLIGQIALLLALRGAGLPALRPVAPARLFAVYAGFARTGFAVFLGGTLSLLLGFVDRLFIAAFYDGAALGTYALALQVLLIPLLGLQAWAVVGMTRIGEASGDPDRLAATVRRLLGRALAVGAGAGVLAAAAAALLERTFYVDYAGLSAAVCTMAVGLVGYHAVSAVAPLMAFRNRQAAVNRLLAAALPANIAIDAVMVASGQSWLAMAAVTSGLYVLLALLTARLAWRCLPPRPAGAPAAASPAATRS